MTYYYRNIAFILLVCMFSAANIFAQTNTKEDPNGYNIFYYPGGRVASEGMMRNGKPDGYWKSWYPTGVLKAEGNRINTLKDSIWVFYTQTGDTLEIINYRLDKKSGFQYQYETVVERNSASKHYLKSKELFLDDRREGTSYYYYPSGKVRQFINYKGGKKQGESKEFDENGDVITLYKYHNDYMTEREYVNRRNVQGEKIGTWKNFYPDGKLKEEEYYKNGVLEGTSRMYSDRGTLINELVYRDGKIIEEGILLKADIVDLTTYYEDDVTIMRKGNYIDSIPVGYHYFYDREGKPEKSIRYNEAGIRIAEGPFVLSADGKEIRVGEWKLYFETGELRSSGRYVNNRQHGEWNFYFINGKKMQTGNFNNGAIEGEWKWYNPSGGVFREEVYERGKPNGVSIQYSDSATVISKGAYIDGERDGYWMECIGNIREEGVFVMDLKEGVWKSYQMDGQLYHSGAFVQGNPDGRHLFYYPDGTLKEEQYYVMGRRVKNWKKYYEDGNLFLTITYDNDQEVRINGVRIDNVKK